MDTDVSRAPCDIGNMVVAHAIAICCINTSKVHMCLECDCSHVMYYIYRHWWTCISLVSTSVCSYDMDGTEVAHANTYTHVPHILCICNGTLPRFNVVEILWLQLTLIIRARKWQEQIQLILSPKKCIFSCIFHSNLLCHCTCNAGTLLPQLSGCAFMTGWVTPKKSDEFL